MRCESRQVGGDFLHRPEHGTFPVVVHPARAQALEKSLLALQDALQSVHRKRKDQRRRLLHRVSPLLDLAGPELRRLGEDLPGGEQSDLEGLNGIDSVHGLVDLLRKPQDADPARPVSPIAYGSADLDFDGAGSTDRRTPDVATMSDAPPERDRRWTAARTAASRAWGRLLSRGHD